MSAPPIVIAGGGIGGLTLALALAARGIGATVIERAPRLEEIGAGIQISPNAGRVLDALGLGPALDAVSVRPERIAITEGRSGRALAEVPLGTTAERRHGGRYRLLHRADLQAVLLRAVEATPSIALCLGEEVTAVQPGPTALSLRTRRTSGEERTLPASLLVGADGIWSTVQRHVRPSPVPRPAGYTAWRALIPAPHAPQPFCEPAVHLWLAPAAHLVAYPVSAGQRVNVVVVLRDARAEQGWNLARDRGELAAATRGLAAPARRLIEAAEHWSSWCLYQSSAEIGWRGDRIALLGDAAHPVLPFLAQGAVLAIEDAAVLARAIADHPDDLAAAAQAYEADRRPRWAQVQRAAASNGRIYHLDGVLAGLRDTGLRLAPKGRLLAAYDWLFGWRPSAP